MGKIDDNGNLRYNDWKSFYLPPSVEEKNDKTILGSATVMHIDGDGLNDLIFPYYSNIMGIKSELLYVVYGKELKKRIADFRYFSWRVELLRVDKSPLHVPVDVNGDGCDDIITLETSGDNGLYRMAVLVSEGAKNTDGVSFVSAYKDVTLPSEPKRMYVGDCNNDGLADLIIVCENGYSVFFNNGYGESLSFADVFTCDNNYISTYFNSPFHSGIKDYWRMEQGDFDGDGLLDFFYHDKETTSLGIAYNNGDGTFRNQRLQNHFDIYELTDREDDNDKFAVHVMDFDRDGRSDVFISKFNVSETRLRWLRSTGNDLEEFRRHAYYSKDEAKERYIFTGDFDGDGQIELANVGFYLNADQKFSPENTIHIYKVGDRDASLGKVKNIKDGYGNITNVSYEYATNPEIYTNGESAYPVNSYTMPVALVSNVTSHNMNLSYRYGGMKMHIAGRGMMGFGTTTKTDNIHGVTESKEVTK